MYTTPDTDTMQGRQLDGLLQSRNRSAKMLLTVDITKAAGGTYHQTYRAKRWEGRDGHTMLTLDLGDGDWAAGTYATKVVHVDTTTGTVRPAKGMTDKALLYGAECVLRWAFTGQAPQPGNGTVAVEAAQLCGCCGRELTHPVSLELGIGPECAKRMGLEHHYRGTTLTQRAAKAAARAAQDELVERASAAAAEATQRPAAPPRQTIDASKDRAETPDPQGHAAELAELYEDGLVAPCQACSGQSKRAGYRCGYCDSTGVRTYSIAGVDPLALPSLASLAATARELATRMGHMQGSTDYVRLADQLDSCMGTFTGDLHEARAAAGQEVVQPALA